MDGKVVEAAQHKLWPLAQRPHSRHSSESSSVAGVEHRAGCVCTFTLQRFSGRTCQEIFFESSSSKRLLEKSESTNLCVRADGERRVCTSSTGPRTCHATVNSTSAQHPTTATRVDSRRILCLCLTRALHAPPTSLSLSKSPLGTYHIIAPLRKTKQEIFTSSFKS